MGPRIQHMDAVGDRAGGPVAAARSTGPCRVWGSAGVERGGAWKAGSERFALETSGSQHRRSRTSTASRHVEILGGRVRRVALWKVPVMATSTRKPGEVQPMQAAGC